MAIIFTWAIDSLQCVPAIEGHENVVSVIHWRLAAADAEQSASICGAHAIPFAEGEGFTPYAELTAEIVIGWLKASIGEDNVAALEASVADELARVISPPVVTPPLPWEGG